MPESLFPKLGGRAGPRARLGPALVAQRAPRRRLCHVPRRRERHLSESADRKTYVAPPSRLLLKFGTAETMRAPAAALLSPSRITSRAACDLSQRETHSRKRRHAQDYRRQSNAAPDISLRRRDKRSSLFLSLPFFRERSSETFLRHRYISPLCCCVRLFAPRDSETDLQIQFGYKKITARQSY